jgi:hypothetical protein
VVVVVDPRRLDTRFIDKQGFAMMHVALLNSGSRPVFARRAANLTVG